MRYLQIRGERKLIPGFPHHKDFVYRCYRFFEVKSLFNFLTIDGKLQLAREVWNSFKYGVVIPRLMLVDPTSGCNLNCHGCWAADYSRSHRLTYERLDRLFTEAQKIGVLTIIMSGGEPMLRKDEILRLCNKHRKLTFAMFTNGTLIDEPFVIEMAKAGNLNVFISIEGTREETDARRGTGTYDKVIAAMDLMKKHDIGFAFSTCYHSGNYKTVASDEFLDFLVAKGAWFGWMFNYLPIGCNSDVDLCCSAEEREWVARRIDEYQRRNRFAIIDFANSGHKAIGCVAAGSDFAHINAAGDLEPCAFCHYSDSNINDMSLVDALKSPLFRNFRRHKPISSNSFRPCPMMDVPDKIVSITNIPGVRSTHMNNPESAEMLASKTRPLADKWKSVAEKLYEEMPPDERRRFTFLSKMSARMKNK